MWLDLYNVATKKTKIAAVLFVFAKLFFLLTCLSLFIGGPVLYLNLAVYISLVISAAALCIYDFGKGQEVERNVR